jgi:hypothetical protein
LCFYARPQPARLLAAVALFPPPRLGSLAYLTWIDSM